MEKNKEWRRRWKLVIIIPVIAGALLWLLPYLFQLPFVQEKARHAIARLTGGATFEEAALVLFPRPVLHLKSVHLKSAAKVSGTVDELSVFPKIPSLCLGKIQFTRIIATHPDLTVSLPETVYPDASALGKDFLDSVRKNLPACATLLRMISGDSLTLDISDGAFSFFKTGRPPLFSFHGITGRLHWKLPELSVELISHADIWNTGSIAFNTDLENQAIRGKIALKNLNPKPLADLLFPDADIRIDSATLDAAADFKSKDFKSCEVNFTATNPDVHLLKGKSGLQVLGEAASGSVSLDKGAVHISVSDLNLSSPRVRLKGTFDLDPGSPSVGYTVNAENTDLASIKSASLFFAGRFRTTRHIFDILPRGTLSRISLKQTARTPEGLRDISSLFIEGELNQADVYISDPDLLLEDTIGQVTVRDGLLEARHITTRLGNSTGENGIFTMPLTGTGSQPFYVEGDVHADLAQLPPLLARLSGATLSTEMKAVRKATGAASGRMILDHKENRLDVTVDAAISDLTAVYDRIPYPVSVSGGEFRYRSDEIDVKNLQGTIGKSLFSDLSAKVSWHSHPVLTISSARMDVTVDEVVGWINSNAPASGIMKHIQADGGRISLTRLQFDGPVRNPAEWRFETAGQVTSPVTFRPPSFPGAMIFSRGGFSATQDRIDVTDADILALDAHVCAGGSWENYLTGRPRLSTRIDGKIGKDANEWIFTHAAIPETCRWRSPITASSLDLLWEGEDRVNVSGRISTDTGQELSMDIGKTPEGLDIRQLSIRDETSRADIAAAFDSNRIAIGFSGVLGHETLDTLLLKNAFLSGSISGDVRACYYPGTPLTSTLTGRLQATGIDMTTAGVPLTIEELSLSAEDAAADISAARFSWRDTAFSSAGRISQTENRLVLELTLSTETLDWPRVQLFIKDLLPQGRPLPSFLFGTVRMTCESFNLTPATTFTPLEVDLKLNGDQKELEFRKADACGISFPGSIFIAPGQPRFTFTPQATGQLLEPAMACLWKGATLMDGRFDLTGDVSAQLNGNASIAQLLEGTLSLTAEDGRIYRAVLLAKIFSLLNITEIFSGQFPDLEKEGFPYNTSIFEGNFEKGLFHLRTGVIDSQAMKLFFEGEEDIVNRKHDLTIVVAPLRTVDKVVGKIPIIKELFNKGAVVYPVRVTGSWDKPEVTLLSPTAVGEGIWNLMMRTLRLPITLLEKVFPRTSETP